MILLGIDPSFTKTGWSIMRLNDEGGVLHTSGGGIASDPSTSLLQRITHIVNELTSLDFSGNGKTEMPDYVFIESEAYGGSGQVVQLSELTGAIKHWFHQFGSKVLTFTPLQARKMVLGHSKVPYHKEKQMEKYIDFIRSHARDHVYDMDFGYGDADRYDACVIVKAGRLELLYPDSMENLMLMRLRDEKFLVKNRKGLYTMGKGKNKVQFKTLKTVDKKVVKQLLERYREILGTS